MYQRVHLPAQTTSVFIGRVVCNPVLFNNPLEPTTVVLVYAALNGWNPRLLRTLALLLPRGQGLFKITGSWSHGRWAFVCPALMSKGYRIVLLFRPQLPKHNNYGIRPRLWDHTQLAYHHGYLGILSLNHTAHCSMRASENKHCLDTAWLGLLFLSLPLAAACISGTSVWQSVFLREWDQPSSASKPHESAKEANDVSHYSPEHTAHIEIRIGKCVWHC